MDSEICQKILNPSAVSISSAGATTRRKVHLDSVLARLVGQTPKATVTPAGIQTSCLLDTGTDVSLINSAFYNKYLVDKVHWAKPVGHFIHVTYGT